MKESRLKTIWKDPVWSKIIAFFIISGLTVIYNLVSSYTKESSFADEFYSFWNSDIKLWIILIAIIGYIVLRTLIKKKAKPFVYDDATLELDKALFNEIRNKYFIKETYLDFEHGTFSNTSFQSEKLDFIYPLREVKAIPELEFLHPELETLKNVFLEAINKFDSILTGTIYSDGPGRLGIPREWGYDRHHKAADAINEKEKQVLKSYDELIKKGRRILKI